ncbi:MAG: class I mannose-6-phosphate isomerase [Devosia sp.]
MTLERASERIVRKPWGKTDLRPWSERGHDGAPIGEIWFQRADADAPGPALLLKLLFTDEALSIQVHPDDEFAEMIGLPNGKTEAWYILSAEPAAKIALGLKRVLTAPQLRAAINDGSLPDLVRWQDVRAGDAVLVAAGTIHAIGAGLVIAEIQQRSDATFRLFDHGRSRELHLDGAVGAAMAGPSAPQPATERLNEARLVVARSPYFVFEQIDLPSGSYWEVDAASETWILLLEGDANFDLLAAQSGEAIYVENQRVRVRAGSAGIKGLMAYVASEPEHSRLLSRNGEAPGAMVERLPELATAAEARPMPDTQPGGVRP